jgi:hypothetical protein
MYRRLYALLPTLLMLAAPFGLSWMVHASAEAVASASLADDDSEAPEAAVHPRPTDAILLGAAARAHAAR